MFYSSIAAELLRICRATSLLPDFIDSSKRLIDRVINQGARENAIRFTCLKLFNRHAAIFVKYDLTNGQIIDLIMR